MELKLLNERLNKKYCDFLNSCEDAFFYHTLEYKAFLQNLLSCEEEYYVAIEGGKIIGVLPLLKKNGEYGVVYNSLPYFGSYGGIISNNKLAFSNLLNKYNDLVLNSKVSSSVMIPPPFYDKSFKDEIKFNLIDERIGLRTDINAQADFKENKIKDFHPDTRWSIRRARKNSIKVFVDNTKIDFLKDLYIENMNNMNAKSREKKFFSLIDKYFIPGKHYDIYVAKMDEKIISACLLFYFGKHVEYTIPVILKEYRTHQPLSLIIYTAMCDFSNKGYKYWNWGGTWLSQDGVYKFKKKWDSIEIKYFYYIYINNKNIFHSSQKELEGEYKGFYVIPYGELLHSNLS
jgi:hypothetical protein